jgi:hypothetical protein
VVVPESVVIKPARISKTYSPVPGFSVTISMVHAMFIILS